MHLRMTGNLLLAERGEEGRRFGGERLYESSTEPRASAGRDRARRRPAAAVHRSSPLRPRLAAAGRSAGALSRRADRGRAARRSDDRRADRADRRGPQGAAEVVPARPEGDRGDRQHLRRRGVAPGRAPSAVAGGVDAAGALGGAPRGHRRGARGRPAQRRGLDRRLPGLARRAGIDAGRVPRPHASGRGVPPLRRADQPDRRLRTLHLLLPGLPGQIAPPPAARKRAAGTARARR